MPRGGRPVCGVFRDVFGVDGRSDVQRELLDAESVAGHLLKADGVLRSWRRIGQSCSPMGCSLICFLVDGVGPVCRPMSWPV